MDWRRDKKVKVILHLAAWLLFYVFLVASTALPFSVLPVEFLSGAAVLVLLLIPLYYLHSEVLIPFLLYKNRKRLYFLASALVVFASYFISDVIYWFVDFESALNFLDQHYDSKEKSDGQDISVFFALLCFLGGVVGILLSVWRRYFDQAREKEIIEKEKYQAELQFLKNQINPHFFFNTLNNIYSLMGSDKDLARDGLHKLSKMMRYVIYESENELVSVNQEIKFINEYIALENLRLTKEDLIEFNVLSAFKPVESIPPLLLISFIENAIKHGDLTRYGVVINLYKKDKHVWFEVKNRLATEFAKFKNSEGGVGLDNVRKRLNLIYHPNQFELKITKTSSDFCINLKIPLHV